MFGAGSAMATAAAPSVTSAGGGGGAGSGFLNFMKQAQDPWSVLEDPNASGLQKFMAVLMSSKVQAQSGGGGFSFAGPGSGSNGELEALMRKMKAGMDNNPVLTPVDRPQGMATGPNLPLGRRSGLAMGPGGFSPSPYAGGTY